MVKIRTVAAPEPTGPAFPDWRKGRGFDSERAAFRKIVAAGSLPAVLMLVGRRGLGKTLLAGELAAMVLCAKREACGSCDSCRLALAGAHPEILHLANDGESIDVERAETAQEHVGVRPESGAAARVVIIEDLDRLTIPAANRLLKTLEEPPHGARFILTSSRPGAILATIRSRAVVWRVPPPSFAAFVELVGALAAERGLCLPAEDKAIEIIAKISGNAPGAALRALERGSSHELGQVAAALLRSDRLALFEAAASLRGVAVSGLVDALEIEMNATYQARLRAGDTSVSDGRQKAARRAKLKAARAASAQGRIAVSAQLVAESFALL